MIRISLKMLHILMLCPALLASPVLTLTIDSQLGTSVGDCFERVSIGEQLFTDAIYQNATELSTKECQQLCKQDTQCQTYDYGVGAKGNATCNLSKMNETELQENKMLQKHPDYDVYVRRVQCEQTAPRPMNQQMHESDNALNRPMFRPGEEDRRPHPEDLSPHETMRPNTVPERPRPTNIYRRPANDEKDDRPDDYYGSRPPFNSSPTYGAHSPQEIPYRPDRPYNGSNRPGQYDELDYGSRPNWRPPRPNDKIPDYYRPKPYPPNYVPDEPQYIYIDRHRRPLKPISDCDQNTKPRPEEQPSPDYYVPGGSRPVRPLEPTRPNDKPTYSYTDQYASNYGTSHDNSIYVEIIDPPRPYKPVTEEDVDTPQRPSRPYYYNQGYGSNSYDYSSQNVHSQQSDSQYYANSQYKPTRPYRNPSSNYGFNNDDDKYRPDYYRPPRPADEQFGQSNYNQASYSENYSSQNYAGNHFSYGSSVDNQYNNPRPSTQNTFNNNQSGYFNNNNRPEDMNYGNQMYGQGYQYGSQYAYGDRYSPSYSGPSTSEINEYNYQHGIYGTHLGYGTHHLHGIKPGSYGTNYNDNNTPTNDRPNGNHPIYYQDNDYQYNRRPTNNQYDEGFKQSSTNRPLGPKPTNDDHKELDQKKNQTDSSTLRPNDSSNRPDVRPVYEENGERPHHVPSYIVSSNGNVVTSKPVAVSDYGIRPGHRSPDEAYKACFRRVLAGKRAVRSHVRRVLECGSVEDCRRECATEARFPCESFNYRLDSSFRGKGLCEMMTKPIEAFNLRIDFVDDADYDFYEIDRNSLEPYCSNTLRGPGLLHSGFLSSKPAKEPDDRNQWRDRNWIGEYNEYNNHESGSYRGQTRRYENQIIPYQIGKYT